jgi:hypothetical protein
MGKKEEASVIKALAAVEVDLASSRAMRFACQLGNFMEMEIHPVYVKESPSWGLTIGTGWARHHFEDELIQQGKKEIAEMLESEIDFCPVLKEPRVIYGNRETELLKVMEQEAFDLYIEGAYFPWTAGDLYQKIQSRIFQRAGSPLALARVLRKFFGLLIICLEPDGARAMAQAFARLWGGCALPISLAHPAAVNEKFRGELAKARETLEGAGCKVSPEEEAAFYPEPPADEFLRRFGLVGLALPKAIKKDSPVLTWVAQIKAPLLLVLY